MRTEAENRPCFLGPSPPAWLGAGTRRAGRCCWLGRGAPTGWQRNGKSFPGGGGLRPAARGPLCGGPVGSEAVLVGLGSEPPVAAVSGVAAGSRGPRRPCPPHERGPGPPLGGPTSRRLGPRADQGRPGRVAEWTAAPVLPLCGWATGCGRDTGLWRGGGLAGLGGTQTRARVLSEVVGTRVSSGRRTGAAREPAGRRGVWRLCPPLPSSSSDLERFTESRDFPILLPPTRTQEVPGRRGPPRPRLRLCWQPRGGRAGPLVPAPSDRLVEASRARSSGCVGRSGPVAGTGVSRAFPGVRWGVP